MQTLENGQIVHKLHEGLGFTLIQSVNIVTEFVQYILFNLHTSRESSLSFSRTDRDIVCMVSGARNTTVHITRSNSPDINPVDYTICGIAL